MQIIEQKQYLIDGVPASKYGEWPGIKSNKWNGSIKIVRPADQYIFYAETVLPVKGRRHYSAQPAKEAQLKPTIKLFMDLKNLTQIEEKKKGIRVITPTFTQNKIHFPKKLFPDKKYAISKEPDDIPFHIRTFYPECNLRTEVEVPLEKLMGTKKRVNKLEERRNSLPFTKPGDKNFKNPEYSNNFYKEGGLIPGSTNHQNYIKTVSKQADNFYQTMDLNVKTLNPEKLWKNKVKKESFIFDENYVKTLTAWDKTVLKDHQKSQPEVKGGKNDKNAKGDNKNSSVPKKPPAKK